MSNTQKEEIMEIIKKEKNQNVLRRIIKTKDHHKFTDIKDKIFPQNETNKSISLKDYYSNINKIRIPNITISSSKLNSNNDQRKNVIIHDSKDITNKKLSSINVSSVNNKLNELNHYDSSNNFKRMANKRNHSIYISGMNDSPLSKYINNLNKGKYDNNVSYTQIKPVN